MKNEIRAAMAELKKERLAHKHRDALIDLLDENADIEKYIEERTAALGEVNKRIEAAEKEVAAILAPREARLAELNTAINNATASLDSLQSKILDITTAARAEAKAIVDRAKADAKTETETATAQLTTLKTDIEALEAQRVRAQKATTEAEKQLREAQEKRDSFIKSLERA